MRRSSRKQRGRRAASTAPPITLALLLAVGLAGVGLTACGGAQARTGAAACDSPGVTKNKVLAGLLYPDSGPLGPEFIAYRGGVDARLALANSEGGVHGRQVTYALGDDQSDVSANLAQAKRLVEVDHVFGIMETTIGGSGSAQWLNQQGIPVTGDATEPVWTQYRNMFSFFHLLGNADDGGVDTYGRFAKRFGGTRAAIITVEGSVVADQMTDAMAASFQAAGIPVVARIVETPNITSPKTTAAQILASKADVVAGYSTGKDFADAVNLARQEGAHIQVPFASNGYHPLANLNWPDGTYTYLQTHPFETGSSAIKTFLDAMNRYAPEVQPATTPVAMHGWIVADMFLTGLNAAGSCPTRASFMTGLGGVKNYDADGLTSNKVDFTRDFGVVDKCFSVVRYDAATAGWSVVPEADPFCGDRLPRARH
jgi:ABC-type branched-subunit amino acid transport system substrate-binding protein